jgi:thiosulfate/3-mercaptopyruvate sulfurtransferase
VKTRLIALIWTLLVSLIGVAAVNAQDTATGPLVSADWLEQNLENPAVRIIEVSVDPGLFERGHVPGAVNFSWHTDFVDPVQRDIVSAERFQELIQAAGINPDTTVVLYGDNNNWFAAWGAWIFNLYGFEDVRLLDGGRVKWEADGRPLTSIAASYEAGSATVATGNADLRALKDEVLSVVEGEVPGVLIDIRSPAEYNGDIFAPEGVQELAVRAGHIPGAVNIPWGQNVNADGTFKSVEELRALYAGLGIDGTTPITTYCRIGERAALTWFVLHELLGYEVDLYDGSWTEWGNSVGVPVVNPAGTIWGGR